MAFVAGFILTSLETKFPFGELSARFRKAFIVIGEYAKGIFLTLLTIC
jgi:hypothetical protein